MNDPPCCPPICRKALWPDLLGHTLRSRPQRVAQASLSCMNGSNLFANRPTDPQPALAAELNLVVERAQVLAHGLRSFRPAQDLPKALWEVAYLWEESQKAERSPLERLRILGLMASSLDQFFVEQMPLWQARARQDGEYARRLTQLSPYVESLLEETSAQLRTKLLPLLTDEYGVRLYTPEQLAPPMREWLRRFFELRVYPLLTPLAVDPGHPFPFVSSFSLNFIVVLRSDRSGRAWNALSYARIKVPRLLPRFIGLPVDETVGDRPLRGYIQSEEVVRFFLPQLFAGLTVEGAFLFRVVRGAHPDADPEGSIQRRLRQRELNWPVVRLDVERATPTMLLDWLTDHLDAPPYVQFHLAEPLGDLQLVDLANLLEGNDGAVRSDLLGDFSSV